MKMLFTLVVAATLATGTVRAGEKPNVLFIAVDDLNDWVGCLGGHPQARTPNLDRLANSSVLFTNAHCPAASCNPSRTAILSGISPGKSGLYNNGQPMRAVLPQVELLPALLRRHGYAPLGSGKILHYFTDARSWDAYFPEMDTENPIPWTRYPETRPLSLPRAGPWQYVETDWGPLDTTDEEFGGDARVAEWVSGQLARKHDQPLFLACGFYRPHEPWFVPAKYFEPFPLESIQLPPGYREDDLADLPAEGKRLARNRYFEHIRNEGQWKKGIQGYLAAIHFFDTMLGRVLDALENGPNRDNTIVVLWSDHGWHLGEKEHWQKYTAWRACTRVPLLMRVPAGFPALPAGTAPARCDQPVSLLSLMPTLLELTGTPPNGSCDGPSLLPLLKNPSAEWPHVAITHLDRPGSFGLSAKGWRYIRYHTGEEELYHTDRDPHEWVNRAAAPEAAGKLAELRALAPSAFAPLAAAKSKEFALAPPGDKLPESRPTGNPVPVQMVNEGDRVVRIVWLSPAGERKQYAELEPRQSFGQSIRKGAVWLVTDQEDRLLGYFVATGEPGRLVIRP